MAGVPWYLDLRKALSDVQGTRYDGAMLLFAYLPGPTIGKTDGSAWTSNSFLRHDAGAQSVLAGAHSSRSPASCSTDKLSAGYSE